MPPAFAGRDPPGSPPFSDPAGDLAGCCPAGTPPGCGLREVASGSNPMAAPACHHASRPTRGRAAVFVHSLIRPSSIIVARGRRARSIRRTAKTVPSPGSWAPSPLRPVFHGLLGLEHAHRVRSSGRKNHDLVRTATAMRGVSGRAVLSASEKPIPVAPASCKDQLVSGEQDSCHLCHLCHPSHRSHQ